MHAFAMLVRSLCFPVCAGLTACFVCVCVCVFVRACICAFFFFEGTDFVCWQSSFIFFIFYSFFIFQMNEFLYSHPAVFV
jgi:hypothetical protein